MNNTEKLDDIRRRLLRIETDLVIMRRMLIVTSEYVKGYPTEFMTERERTILFGGKDEWINEFTGEAVQIRRTLARHQIDATIATRSSGVAR